jgi:hypothetical protein
MRLFRISTLSLPLVFLLILSACGGSQGPVKVKPESENVSGEFSKNLKVVKRDYKIKPTKKGGKLTIKVKGLETDQHELDIKKALVGGISLDATPLKKDGMPISGAGTFTMTGKKEDKLSGLIMNKGGELFLTLTNSDWKHGKHASKVKTFKVSSGGSED